ncbi:SBBP repeat-containing protein [Pyxidicoccus xibeiensis]|uniref:SBBP repeat-containing protein n=1 Tax=Pyxidicoccus xibeiensis TaxID=2906759 RepID=UPI0020A834D1|nr:SBBP repeat-containing protein [Pyxidicoccus xibeiensis]MCP3142403.1 SBBP repeat-containing protein [Pyxidicoccus xibeiensis]
MRVLKPIRSIFLTSALVLASVPGCGGEPAPVPEAGDATGTREQGLVCENVVPVMTGPNTPSGAVTRSGVFGTSYEAWQAFDGTNSLWLSAENQTPAWVGYQWASGTKTIHRYALSYANGSITTRAPKQWTFEGWNGSAWVVLDSRFNQVNWAGHERREYTVASPGAYARYRLNVTDDNDTRAGIVVVSLGRLELMQCLTASYPTTQALWTRTSGAAASFTRVHDLATDPAGRNYVTGMTLAGLEGKPLVGLMDGFLTMRDWNGKTGWSAQLGAPDSVTLGYGIARNRRFEEIYVAGFTDGSVDGTPKTGSREALLTKYRYTGVRGWTRQLGAVGASVEGYAVGLDAGDNAFLAGSVNGALDGNPRIGNFDAFVAKYDAAGNKLWTRTLGAAGASTHGRRASADDAGNVYVSGWTTGALDGNVRMGPQDFFVVKYDGAGNKQWTRQLGTPGTDVWLYGSALDAAGNIYLAGYSGGGLDGNPNVTGGIDAFVTKFDAAGVKQWTRELGGSAGVWGTGLFIDTTGVYLTGSGGGDIGSSSSTDASKAHNYVAKFDMAGTRQWVIQQDPARLNGAYVEVYSNGLGRDDAGNFFLGGYTSGNFDGNTKLGDPDGFVTKLPAR